VGKALLTILVDDLDDQVAQLASRGLPVGSIDVIAGSVRRVVISDPEGNRITFGQPPP
jgi:predicted enzyme related to lactoylglutathione lyase